MSPAPAPQQPKHRSRKPHLQLQMPSPAADGRETPVRAPLSSGGFQERGVTPDRLWSPSLAEGGAAEKLFDYVIPGACLTEGGVERRTCFGVVVCCLSFFPYV